MEWAVTVDDPYHRVGKDGDFVLKFADGKLERQPITSARTWENGSVVEIATGIKVGDTVVTAPLPMLQPGTLVTVDRS